MKLAILSFVAAFCFTLSAHAQTACQRINSTGRIDNPQAFAKSTNKLLKSKGVKYRTTSKEVNNTVKNFCRANPAGTEDDIIKHFIQLSDVLAAAGG